MVENVSKSIFDHTWSSTEWWLTLVQLHWREGTNGSIISFPKISCNPIYFREMGDNNKTDRILLLPPAKLMQPASHLSQKPQVTIFEAGNKCLFIRIMRKPPYFYKSISREITNSQKLGNMLSFFQCPKFCTLQLSMFVGVLHLIHWPHFYQNIPKWFWFHWMQNADATHESECWLTDLFWMI